jgi:hypothetical protein
VPRYAYLPYAENYKNSLVNIEVEEFKEKKVIAVDSTKITFDEHNSIKKDFKESYYCYVCDTRMGLRRPKNKHPHFFHLDGRDCFEAESLVHAEVKKNLYDRFKKQGFKVMFERVFKAKNKKVRTDVAVMQKKDILAVEVQASPSIKRATIAERTNAYASAGIPTAWVVVLDSFFGEGNFTSTKEQVLVKNDDGTSSYEERLLPYEKPTLFTVTVEIPKSFDYLLDTYKYIVAVNHEGHFFVIRRKEVTGSALEIYRVEQNKVVNTLLATDIITMDYESDNDKETKLPYDLEHTDGQHFDEEVDFEFMSVFKKMGVIDFVKAFLEEQKQLEHETAIDILSVIEETKLRERMHAKKTLLMNELDQDIINLREEYKHFKNVINLMKVELNNKLEEMQSRQEKLAKEIEIKKEEKLRARKAQQELAVKQEMIRKREIEEEKQKKSIKKYREMEKKKEEKLKEVLLAKAEELLVRKRINDFDGYTDNGLITIALFNNVLDNLQSLLKKDGLGLNVVDYIDRYDVTMALERVTGKKGIEGGKAEVKKIEVDIQSFSNHVNKQINTKDSDTNVSKGNEKATNLSYKRQQDMLDSYDRYEYEYKQKRKLISEINSMCDGNLIYVDDMDRLIKKRLSDIEIIHEDVKRNMKI